MMDSINLYPIDLRLAISLGIAPTDFLISMRNNIPVMYRNVDGHLICSQCANKTREHVVDFSLLAEGTNQTCYLGGENIRAVNIFSDDIYANY